MKSTGSFSPFEISDRRLRSLGGTRPGPGEAAALDDWLHSRRLVLLKTLLTRAERARLPEAAARKLDAHWALLEHAERRDPAAMRAVLGYPAVGNWLARALEARTGDDFAAALAGSGTLAATVATVAGCDFRVELPVTGGHLVLPGLGAYAATTPAVRLEAAGDTLTFTPDGGTPASLPRTAVLARRRYGTVPWHPLSALPGGAAVLDDRDPHLGAGTGPQDPAGLRPATVAGSAEERRWRELWSGALALLREVDAERAAETAGLVRAVVPVRSRPEGSVSATRLAAPWAVLTTRPRTGEEMAEVLVHEVQHSKLAVLEGVAPLSHAPADGERAPLYRVAWRSDPRPLGAVVQGTYAHLALADLWDRLARRDGAGPAAREAARRRSADFATQVDHALFLLLGSGQLTREGTEFVEGMRRRHARLTAPGGRDARGATHNLTNRHFG
ncbi:aKG-HExxH-type peptide beta-hydroxylase [Streptomyces albus]|uniref:aKG-HExxH-type peptide beta-hydroxylase n=1 Tax=Streptomyces TaxID=1883 RepID=UPI00034E44EC|nr:MULTISPECIES: HEXXH motif-containing putative peptide modification protein [Streptomyces]EPD94345.1 HEXXH domain-containing protein domain [Streptomyces sp. HPH0547]UVN54807.1 HEXXH motif-containing putative peptide modification protein [Streptomyces albus]